MSHPEQPETLTGRADLEQLMARLRNDPQRMAATRRLWPTGARGRTVDRLADLAARLVGASAGQVSLLGDVQLVAGGAGLPAGTVGSEGPLEDSLCTVTAAGGDTLVVPDARTDDRVRELRPVTSGRVGAYLGAPLAVEKDLVVGALCVFDPRPRTWSATDVAIVRELATSVVTELELSALTAEYEADRLRWGLAVDAAGIGTFDWDLRTGRLVWDDRLREIFGYDSTGFTEDIAAFDERLHPDDLVRVHQTLDASIDACGEYEEEFRILRPDGTLRWVQARGRALAGADGTAVRVLGVAYDTTDERSAESRVARVLETMPAGFYSLDREWRFTHLNGEAERLLRHTREELLGRQLWEAFPHAVGSAFEERFREAVRLGTPVTFDARYPAPVEAWFELRAWPGPDGLSVYFSEISERRRTAERAERASQRLGLLAEVGAELADTLDARAATGRLSRLVVPALAEWCIVTVLDADGRPRDVGSRHRDPDARRLVERYAALRMEALPATAPVHQVLQHGTMEIVPGAEIARLLGSGDARDAFEALGRGDCVLLPLRGRGRTLGVLSLFLAAGTASSAEDLATARDVADRAGLALDNARLYAEQQQLAEGLQRSLLTEPPEPDHAQIAVRYLPAAEAARVGGDWYDAFLQPDGTTMLVIGDVAGHDTAAAAAMGQLRGLLRGIATYSGEGPAEVLRGLDASMRTLALTVLATAAVARLEQTPEERRRGVTRLRWANAGHLPPLVIAPDGTVGEVTSWRGDLLLGVDPDVPRRENVVTLERGSTVLLYTDGLVERRDADLDAGLLRLRETLAGLADRPLDELLDEVLERLVQGRPEDDVALVAVRLHPQDRPRPAEAGPRRVPAGVPPEPPAGSQPPARSQPPPGRFHRSTAGPTPDGHGNLAG